MNEKIDLAEKFMMEKQKNINIQNKGKEDKQVSIKKAFVAR